MRLTDLPLITIAVLEKKHTQKLSSMRFLASDQLHKKKYIQRYQKLKNSLRGHLKRAKRHFEKKSQKLSKITELSVISILFYFWICNYLKYQQEMYKNRYIK